MRLARPGGSYGSCATTVTNSAYSCDRPRSSRAAARCLWERRPRPRGSRQTICCCRRSSASSAPPRSHGRATGRCGRCSACTGSRWGCSARDARLRSRCRSPSRGSSKAARLLGIETDEMASTLLVLGLACFAAGLHVRRSSAAAGLASVLAAVALMAGANAAETGDLSDVMLEIAFVVPWAVGVALGDTLERTRALAAEAERASLERELETERAAALERQRIARELHDLLANSLSVMIVQASLAADLVVMDPAAAAAAVGEVERSGRTALGEIGVLLRLVQDDAGGFSVQPQHGVADLPALADEYERAGLGIDLEFDDVASRLPVGVELSTYRIVQEALTNALKHAPGSPVRVRLARAGSEVAIEVRNGPAAAAAFAVVPGGTGWSGCASGCRCSAARSTPARRPTADSCSRRRCRSRSRRGDERRPRRRPGARARWPAGAARGAGRRRARRGRARAGGRRGESHAAARRARDGHPDARHGRHRRDPRGGRRGARDARADPDDL